MLQLGHQIPVRTTNGKKPEHGKPLISSRILRPVTKKRSGHHSGGQASENQRGENDRRRRRRFEVKLQLNRVNEGAHHHVYRIGGFIKGGFPFELPGLPAFDKNALNQL